MHTAVARDMERRGLEAPAAVARFRTQLSLTNDSKSLQYVRLMRERSALAGRIRRPAS